MSIHTSPARVWRYRRTRYSLVAVKCTRCGKIYYPPRMICECGCKRLIEYKLSGKGIVEAYTISYNVQEGFREHSPLIFGIIKLEEGIRVLAQLTDVTPEEVKVGMKVEATLRKVLEDGDTGLIRYGVKFRPVLV